MAADDGQKSGSGSPGDSGQSKGRSSFVPRWRKHTAEAQPIETPAIDPAAGTGVHPNLQPQSQSSSTKKFQPRWRQRAEEMAAKEEQQALKQELQDGAAPPVDKPGFQPRWRRTAAVSPSPSPEAPLEPQSSPTKRFQPKWRERAERPPQEAPPKVDFTPRWKRTLATATETPPEPLPAVSPEVPEVPEVVATPAVLMEVPQETVLAPAEEALQPAELVVAVPEVVAAVSVQEPAQPQGLAALVPLATPVSSESSGSPEEIIYAPTQPVGQSVEDVFLAGPVEQEFFAGEEVLEVEPVPEPAPAVPEKKRLPRPGPAAPKVVAEVVPMVPAVTEPEPEPEVQVEAEPEIEVPVATPEAVVELRFLPAPIDEEVLVEVEPAAEAPNEQRRVPKRLDDEAMAALKATASMLTAPHRQAPPVPTPPPPPPPPVEAASEPAPRPEPPRPEPPQAAPRYVPTPAPRRTPASPAPAAPKPAKAKPKKKFSFRPTPTISMEDVSTFTRQFAVMIGAGLPIHEALNFFAESSTGPLGKAINDVATKISSGFRLSNAMAQHPTVFTEVYLGLIELGESTSHIDEALEKLADLLEKQVKLGKRLQSALVYPAFLVSVSMAAVGVFLQYVLPTMIPLFKSFSMTLPLPTRMLLASRHLVWPSVIAALVVVIFWAWFKPAWNQARRRKAAWAYRVDRLTLKIPVFGKFIRQIAIARVLFALATMIETGLPIMNALKRCESVASNLEFAGRLERAGEELRDGSTVTEALTLHEVLPASCLHLLSAGEESAQMAEMVSYAARFYEEEVDHSIDQFMSLVEPVIMCIMGIVVGFIVLSAVLPTVEMINHLGT